MKVGDPVIYAACRVHGQECTGTHRGKRRVHPSEGRYYVAEWARWSGPTIREAFQIIPKN